MLAKWGGLTGRERQHINKELNKLMKCKDSEIMKYREKIRRSYLFSMALSIFYLHNNPNLLFFYTVDW